MNETNTTYTPVADGFHDCKIVFAKRAEKHYGKEIVAHVVFELKLVPTDCPDIENPAAYRAEFPVVIVPGMEWDFYNEKLGKGEWRKATAEDTKNVIAYAQRCFPAWKEYCDGLPDGSDELAFGWFVNSSLVSGVTVRAKLTNNGTYTGTDGMEHDDLKARIYAPYEAKPIVADGEARQISNALKAAGVKLFGKAKTATAGTTASKLPQPPKPTGKSVEKLREEAFEKYQVAFKDDKTGAGFYPKCAEIVKKDMNTWESWNVYDWTEICEQIDMPF